MPRRPRRLACGNTRRPAAAPLVARYTHYFLRKSVILRIFVIKCSLWTSNASALNAAETFRRYGVPNHTEPHTAQRHASSARIAAAMPQSKAKYIIVGLNAAPRTQTLRATMLHKHRPFRDAQQALAKQGDGLLQGSYSAAEYERSMNGKLKSKSFLPRRVRSERREVMRTCMHYFLHYADIHDLSVQISIKQISAMSGFAYWRVQRAIMTMRERGLLTQKTRARTWEVNGMRKGMAAVRVIERGVLAALGVIKLWHKAAAKFIRKVSSRERGKQRIADNNFNALLRIQSSGARHEIPPVRVVQA